MENILTGIIVITGIAAALFLLVISYLQYQLREPAYRIWEIAWGSYLVYLVLMGFEVTVLPSAVLLYAARIFLIGMVIALLASSKSVQQLQDKIRISSNTIIAA